MSMCTVLLTMQLECISQNPSSLKSAYCVLQAICFKRAHTHTHRNTNTECEDIGMVTFSRKLISNESINQTRKEQQKYFVGTVKKDN